MPTFKTDSGSASFERDGKEAVLKVEYRIGEQRATGENAVEQACEQEIVAMREAITKLGHGLAAQVSDVGGRPTLRRTYEDDDERKWSYDGRTLTVADSTYASEEALTLAHGVSEKALVLEVAKQMVEQRTKGVRAVYADLYRGLVSSKN